MTESLANFFVNLFGSLNGNIIIFLISLLPLLELRGGLIAASLLNLPFTSSFIICLIGNILPIPFILLFLEKIFTILKKSPKIASILNKLEAKSLAKSKDITKYTGYKYPKQAWNNETMVDYIFSYFCCA